MMELVKWYEANHRRRFEWGKWDCILAAADWWQASTGVDPVSDVRGKYSTGWGATQLRGRMGASIQILITKRIGEPVDLLSVRDGGLILIEHHVRTVLTIVHGCHLIAPKKTGLVLIPRHNKEARMKEIAAWTLPTTTTN